MCSNCVSIYSVSKVLFCKVPTKVSTNQPTNLPTYLLPLSNFFSICSSSSPIIFFPYAQ